MNCYFSTRLKQCDKYCYKIGTLGCASHTISHTNNAIRRTISVQKEQQQQSSMNKYTSVCFLSANKINKGIHLSNYLSTKTD